MKIHTSVNLDRVIALAEESMFGMGNPGICIACGEDAEGVESDADGYTCDVCEEPAVYGSEELMLIIS
jgi:hypothetical protein